MAEGRLTARAVASITVAGRYGDGRNLYLAVSPSGTKSWVFRYKRDGKARERGLGAFPLVSLADARRKAEDARRVVSAGSDPLDLKKAASASRKAEKAVPT